MGDIVKAAELTPVAVPARRRRQLTKAESLRLLGEVPFGRGTLAPRRSGRWSSFLDSYLRRDIAAGRLSEVDAQELVDDLPIKLRIVRFLRTLAYDELFSGDPTWVTETIGGIGEDGARHPVRRVHQRLPAALPVLPEPRDLADDPTDLHVAVVLAQSVPGVVSARATPAGE